MGEWERGDECGVRGMEGGGVRSDSRQLKRLALLLVFLLALVGRSSLSAQSEAGPQVGDLAPAVVVSDLDGRAVNLGEVLGKQPVLLEFWATWCTSCAAMLPKLQAAASTFGNDVVFWGINVTISETRAGVLEYVAQHAPPFRVLYDSAGTAARAYDPPATSYIVIVDRSGRIAYTGVGGTQQIENALRKVTAR